MAASNFTIIYKDENNVVDLRPIPVEATYKSAKKNTNGYYRIRYTHRV